MQALLEHNFASLSFASLRPRPPAAAHSSLVTANAASVLRFLIPRFFWHKQPSFPPSSRCAGLPEFHFRNLVVELK